MSPVLYFIYDTETCLISTQRGQAVDINTRVRYKTQINVLLGPKTKVFHHCVTTTAPQIFISLDTQIMAVYLSSFGI